MEGGGPISSSIRDGTFLIGRLRPGDYELKAMEGSGSTMQFASLPLTIGAQDRSGVELRLKPATRQKGRVVIEGAGRVEDLQRFRLVIEIVDVLGVHPVPIAADGTFEFQSFEGGYSATIKDLPLGYEPSIVICRIHGGGETPYPSGRWLPVSQTPSTKMKFDFAQD